ncbi:hypothetical protein CVT24_006344 [Panaeolus cyanescens]|uniref:Retrovirus-related Pol polyprotein from transposon TNT 1-94-like beta-barrel domain-containing protein n=1 Tax=Panaeolus cyanescens TaxID=181874 RepID=A0A409YEC2_9AGAR|nr:hypothetical protein CVT24_006344 [Panaeolus cyanescens]
MAQTRKTRKHSVNPYIISGTAPTHLSNIESDFVSIRSIDPKEVSLKTALGDPLIAQGRGDIKLTLANGKTLILKDALYIPLLTVPLLSCYKLSKDIGGISVETTKTGCILRHSDGQLFSTATNHPKYGLPGLDLNNAVDIPLPDPSEPRMAYCLTVL